jgi:phage terminase Nu1 subunit (DNA packaging protein)
MEKNKTKVETVSASELGAMLLVTRKTLAEWADRGVTVRVAHGRYDLVRSVQGFAQLLKERDRGDDAGAVAKVAVERSGLLAVQRKRAEFEFEREQKKWMPADEFNGKLQSYTRWLRDEMLRVPSRIVGVDRETLIVVDNEIRRILTDLAEGKHDPDFITGRSSHG